jgi:CheY-like chemotaxis protein
MSFATLSEQRGKRSMMTATGKPYSILITDDDPECRECLRDIVEPEGFQTVLASSGEEAIDIIRDEEMHVHLALLDMHLPRMTGLETLQMVHQIRAVLPCILVTADATEDLIQQAFSVRAYSVIPKPVSKNVLLYTVVRALLGAYGNVLREKHNDPF